MKIKKIAALLIAFAMFMTNISALAYDAWVENGAISITPVTMADGSELIQFTAGETINLKAQVKAGKDAAAGQTAQLLVVSYKNGFVNAAVPGEKITVTETAAPVTAAFTVPAEGADELKVFVLDGRETRRPLAQMGVAGENSSAEVTDIKIDGEGIEGFSKNTTQYNVVLSAAYMGTPQIVVNTSDILAKAEIVRSGEAGSDSWSEVIDVTKNGESVGNYTINFTQEKPKITNAFSYQWKNNQATNTEVETLTTESSDGFNLVLLTEPTDNGVDYDQNGVTEKPESYMTLDKTWDYMIYDIPDYFAGGILIQQKNVRGANSLRVLSTYSLKEKGKLSNLSDKVSDEYKAYEFDINRSATVYVYNAVDTSSTSVNTQGFTEAGFARDETLALKYYNFRSNESMAKSNHWYKKHVDVAVDSTESVTVPVGGFPMYVIVKFD